MTAESVRQFKVNFEDRDWLWLDRFRRFSPAEDARLRELRSEHSGYEQGRWPRDGTSNGGLRTIAKKLGRSHSSIQMRLVKLARDDEAANRL